MGQIYRKNRFTELAWIFLVKVALQTGATGSFADSGPWFMASPREWTGQSGTPRAALKVRVLSVECSVHSSGSQMVHCPSLSTGTFAEKVWGRALESRASAEPMLSRSWDCCKPFQPHKTLGFFINISEVAQWWELTGATKDRARWHYLIGAYGSRKNDHRAGAAVMDRCWHLFLGDQCLRGPLPSTCSVLNIALPPPKARFPDPVQGRAASRSKPLSGWNEDFFGSKCQ